MAADEVSLEERRRHREHVRDVIEAVARIIHRQHRAGLNIHRQQIADRIAVLGAVEPVDCRPPGVRIGGRVAVEGLFERCRKLRRNRRLGAGKSGRRHFAPAQFVKHLFPRHEAVTLANAGKVEAIE